MFVIMTDFVVHFYVENLLKVLKVLKVKSPVPYLIGTGLGDTVRVSPSSSFAF